MRILFVLRSEGFFPYLSADAITRAIDRELADRPRPRIQSSASALHDLVEGMAEV